MNTENKPPKIESNTPSKVYNDDEIELLRKINDNLDKIKSKINFTPKTSIEVGIPKFVDWYKNYHQIFRRRAES